MEKLTVHKTSCTYGHSKTAKNPDEKFDALSGGNELPILLALLR